MHYSMTNLSHSLDITDIEAQYDEYAKFLMADKQVLAHIAKHRTDEFKTYDIPTIIQCIEGEPEISKISIHPGESSLSSTHETIIGMNTESAIPFGFSLMHLKKIVTILPSFRFKRKISMANL